MYIMSRWLCHSSQLTAKFCGLEALIQDSTTPSKYQLERQYNIVMACACIHNININQNGNMDEVFEVSNLAMRNQAPESPIPEEELSDLQDQEECENWRDSIAQALWEQYVATLETQFG